MSTPRRIAAVVASTLLAVPLWGTPAYADTASEPPSSAAYFNQAGVAKPDASPAAPPNPIASVDGVAPGNLPVAAQAGREDKVTFLFFALSAVPSGATISKATLTMTTVPNSPQNVTTPNATPDKVVACKITGSGFSTEDGEALSLAPGRDCPGFMAAGTGDAAKHVFDITGLAATWAELNDGLALTKDPAKNDPFQVVYTRDAVLDVEFTGGESLTVDVPVTPSTGFDTGTTTTTTTGGSGTADLGFGTTTDLGGGGSTDLGGGFASAAPLTAAPAAPGVPSPETAAAPLAATPVASGQPIEMLSPTVGFWVGALALAAVLAFLSLVLGDPRAPVAATAKPTRLSQALSARQRAGSTSSLVARPS